MTQLSIPAKAGGNYTFDINVVDMKFRIHITKTLLGVYGSVYDLKAERFLIQNRSLVHAVDLFQYCKLPYNLWYLCNTGQDPNSFDEWADGNFVIDDHIV